MRNPDEASALHQVHTSPRSSRTPEVEDSRNAAETECGASVDRRLAEAEAELTKLTVRRAELLAQIAELRRERASSQVQGTPPRSIPLASVTNQSSQEAKVSLFRSLFRGREDVYPCASS